MPHSQSHHMQTNWNTDINGPYISIITGVLVCFCWRLSEVAALTKECSVIAETIVNALINNGVFDRSISAMEEETLVQFWHQQHFFKLFATCNKISTVHKYSSKDSTVAWIMIIFKGWLLIIPFMTITHSLRVQTLFVLQQHCYMTVHQLLAVICGKISVKNYRSCPYLTLPYLRGGWHP